MLIALITNKKLYIANLGICRALLVKNDVVNNVLRVIQITTDHNLSNEDEVLRLCELGLDVQSLRGEIFSTRCIGNYLGKSGYRDSEVFSQANGEPILSQPEIIGPVSLDDQCRFLLMLSGGLCKVLTQLFCDDLTVVNKEIVSIVVEQFQRQSTLVGVAQSVINQISQLHHDLYMKTKVSGADYQFSSRDDMTLLIRNFSYEMPNSIENSRQSSSTITSSATFNHYGTVNTNTSNSSSVNNYSNSFNSERKTKPYVSFKEYFQNVEIARKEGKLPSNIDFDDQPIV